MQMKTVFSVFAKRFPNYEENFFLFLKVLSSRNIFYLQCHKQIPFLKKNPLSRTSLQSGTFPDREKVYQ